jgi:hypothetical protein
LHAAHIRADVDGKIITLREADAFEGFIRKAIHGECTASLAYLDIPS